MTMTPTPPPLPPPEAIGPPPLPQEWDAPRVRPPGILPAILVGLLAMPFAAIVVMLVGVLVAVVSMSGTKGQFDMESMEAMTRVPEVLFAILVTQFAALGFVPIAAAHAGGGGTRATLGLVRPRMRGWVYPFLIVGSFGVMMAAGHLTQLLVSNGLLPQMKAMPADMLLGLPTGWKAACLAVMSVGPGLCEELVFRGYVMRRLARRWKPWAAIGLSSAFFGIAHVHPMHMFFAFLMGLWLGWLAWRTGSIVPSILAHFAVDFTVFGLTAFGAMGAEPAGEPGAAGIAWSGGISIIGLAAAAVVVRATRPRPDAVSATEVLSG